MDETADTRAVRAWLRQNGTPVSDRGRVPSVLIAQYEKAHGIVRIPPDQGRRLPLLPSSHSDVALFVRTDFSDDDAWFAVLDAAEALTREGFRAFIVTCQDRAFEGLTPAELMEHLPNGHRHKALFLVDTPAIQGPEHPLTVLSVDDSETPGAVLRAIPSAVQAISDNLNTANMRFQDFVAQADPDGVLRLY